MIGWTPWIVGALAWLPGYWLGGGTCATGAALSTMGVLWFALAAAGY